MRRAVAGVLLVCAAGAAASDRDLAARIDPIFAEMNRTDRPGCAVGVVERGRLVFAKGYGMADLEHGVAMTPDTPVQIGSLTKSFTATAVALLAEEGRLGLDDEVHRWVPELPRLDPPVRIRHLIQHSSGIRDFLELLPHAGVDPEAGIARETVLALLARQTSEFPAGSDFAYSNSGYFLLALIAERAAGQPLDGFVRARILDPLEMNRSAFDPKHDVLGGRAAAYRIQPDGRVTARPVVQTLSGVGSMWSTVRDLARLDANFTANRLGKGGPELIRLLTAPGGPGKYGFGWMIGDYRGRPAVQHGGAWGGFRAFYRRLPQDEVTAIVLCNHWNSAPFVLSAKVIDAVLGLEPETAPAPRAAPAAAPQLTLSKQERETIPGLYSSRELDVTYAVEIAGEDSISVRIWLHPPVRYRKVADRTFESDGGDRRGNRITFENDAFRLGRRGPGDLRFAKVRVRH